MAQATNYGHDDAIRLRELLDQMEEMDNLMLEMAEEAVRHNARENLGQDASNFPITDIDLETIGKLRRIYANYTPETAVNYVLQLPEIWPHWNAASRGILNLYDRTRESRQAEWTLWAVQVQQAGGKAWKMTVPASGILSNLGGQRALNNMIDRFRMIDDLLESLPKFWSGSKEKLAVELEDTL